MAVQLVLYSTCYIVLLSKICASPEDSWDRLVPSRGETRSYYYKTAVVTTQNGYVPRNTDLQLEARVDVAGLWDGETEEGDKLLRLMFNDVKISSGRKKRMDVRDRHTTTDLDVDVVFGPGAAEHLSAETLFRWRRGQVQGIYVLPNETEVITNIRRGFISLFQFQLQPGEVKEAGLFGVCRVRYSVQPNQVTKHFIPGSCQLSHLKSAGLSQVLEWEFLSQVEVSFAFRSGVLTTANCLEHHILKLPIQESVSINSTSWQEVQLQSTNTGVFTGAWASLEEALNASVSDHVWKPLAAATLPGICLNCVKPKEAMKAAKKLLAPEHVASVSATRAFLQLSQVLRSTSASRILTLLRKEPSDTLPQIVDAVVATQSPAALKALLKFLDFEGKADTDSELLERFLYATALAPLPSRKAVEQLMTILQLKIASSEVHHTAIIVLGAVLGRLCKAELCHDEVGKAAISFLSHGAAHADDTTLLPFLIGLANAHIPSSVPVLLRHAAGASPQAAALSMAALQRLPAKFISAEAQISLLAISRGEGSTHDPAIRILAIETLLMSEPPYDIVRALLADLHNAPSEMARFALAKVAAMIRANHPVSLTIQKALRDPFIKNYDFFSRDGLSSACWGFISQANGSNITYNLDILFSTNGLMRRSNMDVILQGHRDALLVSQVTLEAEGLGSIFGEGLDAGGEDTDATARMSALFFDVQLKPVEFFRGYGDLLSKIWSSTGEPTTAVKGLLSLSRHQQELVLGSGLTLILHGDVALGIDITGNIDVSIWNAKSKTVISSKGAVVVLATAAVVTENWKKGVEVTTDAEVQFDTTTTVHFSRSPYLICLQMERSTFPYREKMVHFSAYQKEEHVLESKRVRVVRIPGAELPLHTANSEMCKQMFA